MDTTKSINGCKNSDLRGKSHLFFRSDFIYFRKTLFPSCLCVLFYFLSLDGHALFPEIFLVNY